MSLFVSFLGSAGSLVLQHRLSLVVEGVEVTLLFCWVRALGHAGSVVVTHELNCSTAFGIIPGPGIKPVSHIGRQILNCWTTRKSRVLWFINSLSQSSHHLNYMILPHPINGCRLFWNIKHCNLFSHNSSPVPSLAEMSQMSFIC